MENRKVCVTLQKQLNIWIMAKAKKVSGYVIYEGASRINGKNIVAVVTMESSNIKTGNMASMWILNSDESPTEASKSGNDDSVCGLCPHRHNLGGACYVTLFQAPLQVWKSYKKGSYPKADNMDIFTDMKVRFGAYGDPYAIPLDILNNIKAVVKNNTSYTHQWNNESNGDNAILKKVSMASVDSIEEAKLAQSKGWRTFRVTKDDSILMENEIICPNYTHDVQCIDCKLCSGASNKKNIVIPVHGAKKNKFVEGE